MEKEPTSVKTESSNPSGGDAARNSNNYNRDGRNRQAQESHTMVPRHTGTPGRTSRTSSATTASRWYIAPGSV